MHNIDWKFWVGDVAIPIVTFVIGFFAGKAVEHKAIAKVKGNQNTVMQNNNITK